MKPIYFFFAVALFPAFHSDAGETVSYSFEGKVESSGFYYAQGMTLENARLDKNKFAFSIDINYFTIYPGGDKSTESIGIYQLTYFLPKNTTQPSSFSFNVEGSVYDKDMSFDCPFIFNINEGEITITAQDCRTRSSDNSSSVKFLSTIGGVDQVNLGPEDWAIPTIVIKLEQTGNSFRNLNAL